MVKLIMEPSKSSERAPRPESGTTAQPTEAILQLRHVVKDFTSGGGLAGRSRRIRAVSDVSLEIYEGEALGLVGESGSGKSTIARLITRLIDPTAGQVIFRGRDISRLPRRALQPIRRGFQIVFQDPYASLNPRMKVHDIVAEPLRIHHLYDRKGGPTRIEEALEIVGMGTECLSRYPHQFSGGQRQRIALARALILRPELLILDEPVSSLDVSIQAQIINLLKDIQRDLRPAILFISHDLAVVKHISQRIAVMYLGRLLEVGTKHSVLSQPTHPYTVSLLSVVPIPNPDGRDARQGVILSGDIPSVSNPPSGCVFRTRCWRAQQRCAAEVPPMQSIGHPSHMVACHFPVLSHDAFPVSGGVSAGGGSHE